MTMSERNDVDLVHSMIRAGATHALPLRSAAHTEPSFGQREMILGKGRSDGDYFVNDSCMVTNSDRSSMGDSTPMPGASTM